jgi:F-type H+-transporting ATPase subunit b
MSEQINNHETNEELVLEDSHADELQTEIHAESENPIEAVAGQFGLNGQIFVAQLINFTIVLVILWLFVYKPIIKILDERKEKIEKSLKQAAEIEERVDAIEKEKESIISQARSAAMQINEKAHADGKVRSEEMVAAAKREVERVISKGKQQLSAEKDEMLRDLRKDIVDISMKAVARITQSEIDEKKSQSLAEEVVRKMT